MGGGKYVREGERYAMWGCEGVGGFKYKIYYIHLLYEHMCNIDEYEDILLKNIKREDRARDFINYSNICSENTFQVTLYSSISPNPYSSYISLLYSYSSVPSQNPYSSPFSLLLLPFLPLTPSPSPSYSFFHLLLPLLPLIPSLLPLTPSPSPSYSFPFYVLFIKCPVHQMFYS